MFNFFNMYLFLRWFISAATLLLVAYLVPGFHVAGWYAAFVAALVLGLVNALIRPILLILTLPVNILTLGLFTLVINAFMLYIVSSVVKGFEVSGFAPAFLGAIVLWLIGWMVNNSLKNN